MRYTGMRVTGNIEISKNDKIKKEEIKGKKRCRVGKKGVTRYHWSLRAHEQKNVAVTSKKFRCYSYLELYELKGA
jgi:hypothetical protein